MSESKLRVLSAADVRRALAMPEAIGLMKDAFVQLSSGQATVPVRMSLDIPSACGRALFMPVYIPKQEQVGVKIVSVMDRNPAKGLPLIQAVVMVMDAATGRPAALMDGEYLTALRTGAASGLATDLLARQDSEVLAIFGAGKQSRTQIEAVCSVRKIKRVMLFNRSEGRARALADEIGEKFGIASSVALGPADLEEADIICTATTSTTPVLGNENLKPGVHINAIGAYQPTMRELPSETIRAAKVVVDERKACLSEAGDLIQPIREGVITEQHIHAEIGEIASGAKVGRESDSEVTVFKSVGNAVHDLASAGRILENAIKHGLGTEVRL